MRYDSEHKQRTRERVLREAAHAIRMTGPDKIGVAGLMAKAGLTHGGFYAHFTSKDDLVAEAISYMFEDRRKVLLKFLHDADPARGLAEYVDFYLSMPHRDRRDMGCPAAALAGDLPRLPEGAKKLFEAGLRNMTNSIAEALKAIGRPQPERLAASMVSEMVGAMALARAVAETDYSAQILDTARASIKERIGLNT